MTSLWDWYCWGIQNTQANAAINILPYVQEENQKQELRLLDILMIFPSK